MTKRAGTAYQFTLEKPREESDVASTVRIWLKSVLSQQSTPVCNVPFVHKIDTFYALTCIAQHTNVQTKIPH